MTLARGLFYLMAFIVVGSSLYVASTRNLVRSVFIFFVTLLALAGLYVLALADFVAITQIVIYVGGILVLIVFAFMLSGKETLASLEKAKAGYFRVHRVPAFLLAGLFFVVLLDIFWKIHPNMLAWPAKAVKENNVVRPTDSMVGNMGVNLMGHYLLPFEAVAVVLLMALVGAAHLSRKEKEI